MYMIFAKWVVVKKESRAIGCAFVLIACWGLVSFVCFSFSVSRLKVLFDGAMFICTWANLAARGDRAVIVYCFFCLRTSRCDKRWRVDVRRYTLSFRRG